MVVAIEEIITKKEPTFVVLEMQNGVSYGTYILLFCAAELELHTKCELLITQIIKEDSHKLYGFLEKDEQEIFKILLKVNGIGATTAIAICSSLDSNAFYKALSLNDESVFRKVPGIDAKSAKRIIVELSDSKMAFNNVNDDKAQALAALLSLNFKQDKILNILATCEVEGMSELVKEALKKLA